MKIYIRKTNIKRRKQGFRARMKTNGGRRQINRRRRIGRKKLTAWN
jgi:ribosomal protein L34